MGDSGLILVFLIIFIHMQETIKVLYDFEDLQEVADWRIINDGVMGGMSKSKVFIEQPGIMTFSGYVSLENNGGFASTRTSPRDYKLGGHKGMRIRVKGDSKTYQIRLKTDTSFDGVNYKQEFETQPGEWIELEFVFEAFQPVYRGRILENIGPPDPGMIRQLGFLISKKQEGPFQLDIDWMKVY